MGCALGESRQDANPQRRLEALRELPCRLQAADHGGGEDGLEVRRCSRLATVRDPEGIVSVGEQAAKSCRCLPGLLSALGQHKEKKKGEAY